MPPTPSEPDQPKSNLPKPGAPHQAGQTDQAVAEPKNDAPPEGKSGNLLARAEAGWSKVFPFTTKLGRRAEKALKPHQNALRKLELGAAVGVIVFAILYLIMFYEQMSRGSLWIDELGNVFEFVQQGPLYIATNYPMARNHVFFNLLLSILPLPMQDYGDINTLEVRLISFIITAIVGLVIIAFFARRRLYVEGAAVFALWAFRDPLIQISLQQRGYTLLALLALLSGIVLLKFFETGKRRWYYLLCLLCGLGVYTMPAYVLFAAPLMLAAWWFSGAHLRTLLAGAVTGATVLLLYLPILPEILEMAATYDETFGRQYERADNLFTTLHYYAWPLRLPLLVVATLLAAVLPTWLYRRGEPEGRAINILIFSVFAFLVGCLAMGTSPLRTTSFTGLPLLLATGLLAARLLRPLVMRTLASVALLGFTALQAPALMEDLEIVPYENWVEAKQILTTSLPQSSVLNLNDLAVGMRYYLHPSLGYYLEKPDILEPPSKEVFEAGRYAVVVGRWSMDPRELAKPRFQGSEFSDRGIEMLVVGRFRHFFLNIAAPVETLVAERQVMTSENLPALETAALQILPERSPDNLAMPLHSLNFVVSETGCWPQEDPMILVQSADAPEAQPDRIYGIQIGRFLTFPLDGRPVLRVMVVADPGQDECLEPESIEQIWFQPTLAPPEDSEKPEDSVAEGESVPAVHPSPALEPEPGLEQDAGTSGD